MDLSAGTPVALTLAIIQAIKVSDTGDRLHKFYTIIAIGVGLVVGALFSASQEPLELLKAAIQNAAYSALAWAAKKAVLEPIGIRLPGDPKKGA